MKILVCVKRVPITGGKITLTADEQEIETRNLGFTISPHEECGVEEAVRIIESGGGEAVVLTLGPDEALEQLRDCMALGVDRAIHLTTQGEEWDPDATALAIVDAIQAEETASGPFDLVIFGNESADSAGYQVGLRVAYALDRPAVTGLKGLAVGGGTVRAEKDVPGGREVYVVPTPAVVTVLEGLNLPRYPSVPGRMRAGRKPVAASTPTRAASQLEMVRLALPAAERKQADIIGHGPEAAAAVVELLRKLGVA